MSVCDEGWDTANGVCPVFHSEVITRTDGAENNIWCGFDPSGDIPDTCSCADVIKLLAEADEVCLSNMSPVFDRKEGEPTPWHTFSLWIRR